MTTDLTRFLNRQTAMMSEYVALAEQYMELHMRLKAGVADRRACVAEMDRLKLRLAALLETIEAGRQMMFSKPMEKAS